MVDTVKSERPRERRKKEMTPTSFANIESLLLQNLTFKYIFPASYNPNSHKLNPERH